jgi:hypothetical protein
MIKKQQMRWNRWTAQIGAMQQAADLLVVLRLFFSEYPEAA